MTQEFKVGQLVTLIKGFPSEDKVFKIVADKENPWKKGSPYTFTSIAVKDDKDYIILMRQNDGTFLNEQHVSKTEIQLLG